MLTLVPLHGSLQHLFHEVGEARNVTLRLRLRHSARLRDLAERLRSLPQAGTPYLLKVDRRAAAANVADDEATRAVLSYCDVMVVEHARTRPLLVLLRANLEHVASQQLLELEVRLFSCGLTSNPLERATRQLGRPPLRAELNAFVATAERAYQPQLAERLPRLAGFLLPHQRANLAAMLAKEHLAIGFVEMLTHDRLRRDRRLLPWICLDSAPFMPPFYSPPNTGRDFWEPNSRSITVINDEVGTGKTASAVAIILANGARGENPLDLDPPTRAAIMPWVTHFDLAPGDHFPTNLHRAATYMFSSNQARHSAYFAHMREHVLGGGGESLLSRNVQDGGTLLLVPANVVDHWLQEIERLQALLGQQQQQQQQQLRVGVVGRGLLRRGRSVSPARLARDYDVVILPHTLMSGAGGGLRTSYFRRCSYRRGFHIPERRMPGSFHQVICRSPSATDASARGWYAVLASDEFLAARLRTSAGVHELRFSRYDPLTNSVVVLKLRAPPVEGQSVPEDDPSVAPLWQLPFDRLLVDGAVAAELFPHPAGWVLGAAFPALHPAVDPEAPQPPADAALHVHWARLVADELHLLANPTTRRAAYMLSLEADHVIGLTAERAWCDVVRHGGGRRLFLYESCAVVRRIFIENGALAANTLRATTANPCRLVVMEPPSATAATAAAGHAAGAALEDMQRQIAEAARAMMALVLADWQAATDRGDIRRDYGVTLPGRDVQLATLRRIIKDPFLLGADAMRRLAMATRAVLCRSSFATGPAVEPAAPVFDALLEEGLAAWRMNLVQRGLVCMLGHPHRRQYHLHHHHQDHHHQQHATHHVLHSLDATPPATTDQIVLAAADSIVCPICFDEDTAQFSESPQGAAGWVLIRPCGHPLCLECWQDMRASQALSRRCPLCRAGVHAYARIQQSSPTAEPTEPSAQPSAQPPAAAEPSIEPTEPAAAAAEPSAAPAKAEFLAQKLVELSRGGVEGASQARQLRGAVVYFDCNDRQMQQLGAWLQARLDAEEGPGVRVFMILSSHSAEARQRTMASLLACAAEGARAPVLLVRYRICAVGVNYIFANHVFFYNMPHRPDFLHQAVGRLCRLGQASSEVCAWPLVQGTLRDAPPQLHNFEALVWSRWKEAVTINEQNRSLPQLPSIMHAAWESMVSRLFEEA
jgi:hypothetical protein